MKKFIITLLLLIPFASGCTTIDTQLTINNDKSAQLETRLSYKGDLNNKNSDYAGLIRNNYKGFIDNTYITDEVTSRENSVITAKKTVKNIKYEDIDMTSLGFVSNNPSKKFVELKQNFFVTSFNIDIVYNYPKVLEALKKSEEKKALASQKIMTPEYLQNYEQFQQLEEQGKADFVANFEHNSISEEEVSHAGNNESNEDVELNFAVKLPSFASYNNADKVKDNVYIWEIRKMGPTVIRLQYEIYSSYAITFILLAGLALLIYIAKRLYKHENLKRIGK